MIVLKKNHERKEPKGGKEITDRWWSVIVTRCWRCKKEHFDEDPSGQHFSRAGWYRAQKHPKILASLERRGMHYSRGYAHVPRSPCLRMLLHTACVCALTSLRSPRRAGRYGARVPTRADGHQTPGSCKHTRYTPACSHTLCRCTGLADATDSITPTGYWRRRFLNFCS